MIVYVIRHAESANNRLALNLSYDEYMLQRSADPPITELGERQIVLLADHLATYAEPLPDKNWDGLGYGITHLFCSPMLRTLQTALPIVERTGIAPDVWVDIHEHGGMFRGNPHTGIDFEIYAGLSRREIGEKYPLYHLPEAITDAGWWTSGYEDMSGCYARAIRVARELRRRAKRNAEEGREERIALVSHGTFMDTLLKAFFDQIPGRNFYFQHYNTGITRIDFAPDGTLFLRYINRTLHLPAEMLSI
jgi:broad specificity phosphatase PhoE